MGDILVSTILPLALAFIMLSLGLGLTPADFARIARRPGAVALGLLAQIVMIPAVAYALLPLAELPADFAYGVMILALCPGGVTSNLLTRLAGGDVALSITLTGVASLLAIFTVPPLAALFAGLILDDAVGTVNVPGLVLALAAITALPVALGVAVRTWAPAFAQRIEPTAARLATLLFVAIVLGAIVANRDLVTTVLPRLGPLLVGLNVALLAGGLALGALAGLDRRGRVAVAMEAGVQNGTLGIAVGAMLAGGGAALPVFALPSAGYGITMYLVALPFVLWARRWTRPAAPAPA
ncbi:MAG: bile acid:sodium symporter family protein [Paracoccaceae bacterium]